MKVIITGSRELHLSTEQIDEVVRASGFNVTEVISGNNKGIDRCGETWAHMNKIPVKIFHANPTADGKAAGPIRNQLMGQYADAAIIVWDGKSPGTRHMLAVMRRTSRPIFVRRAGLSLVS